MRANAIRPAVELVFVSMGGIGRAAAGAPAGRGPDRCARWRRGWSELHDRALLDDAATGSPRRAPAGSPRPRAARAAGEETCPATCDIHGEVMLIRRGTHGFRCPLCRSEAVTARRRRVKQLLVAEHGGACVRCGYARSVAALHFHHVDPATKSFAVAARGVSPLARRRAGRGREMRPAVRELPRGGRRGSRCRPIPPTMSAAPHAAPPRSGVAQSAEHSAVNRRVVGSSPTPGASSTPA